MSEEALELRDVRRVFRLAGTELRVLKGVDLALRPGEIVALVGPSGAGKSTLLHVAGLLERPDGGGGLIAGGGFGNLSDERRTLLRRSEIGFVYQFHHLLPEFSALENVMLPQMIAAAPRRRAREKAAALLDRVGLAARAGHRPARLSGGEQQRVAIARALANDPKILLGDEPTGNLDHATGDSVLETLLDLVRHSGLAALIATHNLDLARRLDRIVALEDGQLRTVAWAADSPRVRSETNRVQPTHSDKGGVSRPRLKSAAAHAMLRACRSPISFIFAFIPPIRCRPERSGPRSWSSSARPSACRRWQSPIPATCSARSKSRRPAPRRAFSRSSVARSPWSATARRRGACRLAAFPSRTGSCS